MQTSYLRIPAITLVLLLNVQFAFAAEVPPETLTLDQPTSPTLPDARVLSVLNQLEEKYGDIDTIQGTFQQKWRSEAFLDEDTISDGEFWHQRPGLFRCDFKKPRESYNIIADNVAYQIFPKLELVEKYVFDDSQETRRHIHRLLIGINVSAKEILSWYDTEFIEAESKPNIAALRFTPKTQDDSGIESISLWVNTETGQPVEWLIDEGEDTKRISIRKLIVDKEVAPETFEAEKYFADYEIVEKLY